MSKTKKTALNALFSAISLVVSSLFGLISTRVVLKYIGSDYNGLNGTISQFLSVLMIVESGFTVAALVKLYRPYGEDDYGEVNKIISKTRESLLRIGGVMLIVGTIVAAIYSLFIKTSAPYPVVVLLFLFSILSTAFNFAYTYKYRLLFQVSQNEYIIYVINIVSYMMAYGGMIVIVQTMQNIVLARAFYAACNILSGVTIGICARRLFPKANFHADTKDVKIEGVKDLFVSKIVGMFYNSLTVFYMSVFTGTIFTSVYAVYNQVIALASNYMNVLFASPRNALGAVVNSDKGRVKQTLAEYEYIVVLISSVVFSVAISMITPFVRLYTKGITDVNYIVPYMGILLAVTAILQLIHIPSGQCIELTGRFSVSRSFQMITLLCLIVFSTVGIKLFGFVGLLFAKLVTNIILAIMEICYTHTKIVSKSLGRFLLTLVPNYGITAVITVFEFLFLFKMEMSIVQFVLIGIATAVANATVLLLFNFVFYRKNLKVAFIRMQRLFRK